MVRENAFIFAKAPHIIFGTGKFKLLPSLLEKYGRKVLLVLGAHSFQKSSYYKELQEAVHIKGLKLFEIKVNGEPSPAFVDAVVTEYKKEQINVVVSIGGGSVLDAGKAISAMLTQEGSVMDFLEGFETRKHNGAKIPFIAVPTTSGTGSEATKNAVLSSIGKEGFKKSLRHDNFVPDIALVDPELTTTCSPSMTAACGLDAITQLLESFVSTQASLMTDALSWSGLTHASEGFTASVFNGSKDSKAREKMSYAALMSGITLANAGLGIIHGFASPIGGFFPIPHGIVCGTLLGAATKSNIMKLLNEPESNKEALVKYAKVGALFSGVETCQVDKDCENLITVLDKWIETTQIPTLGTYGVTKEDIPGIANESANKNNPVQLTKEEMIQILECRI